MNLTKHLVEIRYKSIENKGLNLFQYFDCTVILI